jgi:antitoxin HicB
MRYPAKIKADGKTWMVSFRDFPGVFSQGDTFEDAKSHAVDALESALFDKPVPVASAPNRGEVLIFTTASFDAKLLLIGEMQAQNLRPTELARRLGVTPQEVNRLINLRHTTKIDAIEKALIALGKRLELSLAA